MKHFRHEFFQKVVCGFCLNPTCRETSAIKKQIQKETRWAFFIYFTAPRGATTPPPAEPKGRPKKIDGPLLHPLPPHSSSFFWPVLFVSKTTFKKSTKKIDISFLSIFVFLAFLGVSQRRGFKFHKVHIEIKRPNPTPAATAALAAMPVNHIVVRQKWHCHLPPFFPRFFGSSDQPKKWQGSFFLPVWAQGRCASAAGSSGRLVLSTDRSSLKLFGFHRPARSAGAIIVPHRWLC
jgi:hypothetical protein